MFTAQTFGGFGIKYHKKTEFSLAILRKNSRNKRTSPISFFGHYLAIHLHKKEQQTASSPFGWSRQFDIEAKKRLGKKLTSREAPRYWTEEEFIMVLK